ncbi:MAG: heterodisulfide reductase subunit C [Desulfobacterales bacterium]|nr:MAG: heterodisulfide reductase subunit C [Desulfobacterales bacterium]
MNIFNFKDCDEGFIREVEERSGQDVSQCYQCGNCTAGCPYTFVYDLPVGRIMRLTQTGQRKAALSCRSIWLCASCQSCTTRCPNNIDVACIMDVLRHMSREEGYATEKDVKLFADTFLSSVERFGRVYEMGLMAEYGARSLKPWTDGDLGPKILPKFKLHFMPHSIKGRDKVARIFDRFREGQMQ